MWPWGVQILDCINQRDFDNRLAWVLGEWQVLGKSWAFRGLDPLAWSTGGRPRAPRAGVRHHGSVCVFSYKTSPGRPSLRLGRRAWGCYHRLLHSTLRGSRCWPLWTSVETEAQSGNVTDQDHAAAKWRRPASSRGVGPGCLLLREALCLCVWRSAGAPHRQALSVLSSCR